MVHNGSVSRCPVFIDGERVCEATGVTVSTDNNIDQVSDPRNTDFQAYTTEPEITLSIDVPDTVYVPVDCDSRVEIAVKPTEHDASGWKVIEVWEINEVSVTDGHADLSAYKYDIQDGVTYLGFDTQEVVENDDGDEELRDVSREITLKIFGEDGETDTTAHEDN